MAGAQGRDDGLLVDQARPVSSAGASAPSIEPPSPQWRASGRLYFPDPVGGHDVSAAALAGRQIDRHGGECLVDQSRGQSQVRRGPVRTTEPAMEASSVHST
jgi:hypothetical protein